MTKKPLTLLQTRAIRNQNRGKASGLAAALRELKKQRTEKPHHRYSHFEELSAGEALRELEERLVALKEDAHAAASRGR